ncbi:MAG: hypothetical protein J5J06_04200 [Phycisphaerae bacterium]|nr:hypothetical protein [Phycisphaerae bacterium]
MRARIKAVFAFTSILLALAYMVSFWHPIHVSQVWNKGAQWVELRGGGVRWYYESNRSKVMGGPMRAAFGYYVPIPAGFGFGFVIANDGYRTIAFPGVCVSWYWQPSAYRRCDVLVDLRATAIVAALYPGLSILMFRARRYIRRRRGLCLNCAYDLQGNVSGTCPECGASTKS